MGKITDNLPEFSDKTFKTVTYACATIVALVAGWFIYEMFTYPDFGISAQWNMFKSILITPLYLIGLILAIVNWGKFTHWSSTPVRETYDSGGRLLKREENYDFGESMFWQFVVPFFGHFVIEPLIYAAIIYYPLMVVVAFLGLVLPYALTLLLVLVVVGMVLGGDLLRSVKGHSLVLFLLTTVLTVGIGYSAYYMESNKGSGSLIQKGHGGVLSSESMEFVAEATPTGVDDIQIGSSGGWADYVDGLYDDYQKCTQKDGGEEATYYSFTRAGEEVMEAFVSPGGEISKICLISGSGIKLENGLYPGCPVSDVYSLFEPTWEKDPEAPVETNISAKDNSLVYCTSSDMVAEEKDVPKSLQDFSQEAVVTKIVLSKP